MTTRKRPSGAGDRFTWVTKRPETFLNPEWIEPQARVGRLKSDVRGHPISALHNRLFAPVSIASLVTFRIAFGLIMLWEICFYLSEGTIARYWTGPAFHFTYAGFGWVGPWPGIGMHIHMCVLAVLAAFITVGLFYRVSSALFFLGFAYTFLIERALYLNHLYFACLVSFLMIFVPAHRSFSVDAWLNPRLRADVVPCWPLWLLRTQLAIVYIFGGIAKLNSDWLGGDSLRLLLQEKIATPIVGPLLDLPATILALSWSGLAFDLLIVPLLVWKRTRGFAFVMAVCFHVMNAWFFEIGIFPWFSIAMTTLFFAPDWPLRLFRRLATVSTLSRHANLTGPARPAEHRISKPRQGRIITLMSLYLAVQALIPLRHWVYPGDVAWTEEGHEFSWRMKLRHKDGDAVFVVRNSETGTTWNETPERYLEPWQVRKMATRPELIRQFAHHLAALKKADAGLPVEVRVQAFVALNGRAPSILIDPETDLSKEPFRIGPAKWITRGPTLSAAQ